MIHDPKPQEVHLGPIMLPEQYLLSAIAELVDPKVIVEFGFYNGTSTRCFLEHSDVDLKIYSYDTLDRTEFKPNDSRLTLYQKDMKDFAGEDIKNQNIDIVFFDASHALEDSMIAYEKILPYLTKDSLIIVHDTGYYKEEIFNPDILIKIVKDGLVYHCPDERVFVQTLKDNGYMLINFTCTSKIRHGISILRRG